MFNVFFQFFLMLFFNKYHIISLLKYTPFIKLSVVILIFWMRRNSKKLIFGLKKCISVYSLKRESLDCILKRNDSTWGENEKFHLLFGDNNRNFKIVVEWIIDWANRNCGPLWNLFCDFRLLFVFMLVMRFLFF